LNLETTPPQSPDKPWMLKYGFDSDTPNRATKSSSPILSDDHLVFEIPIKQKARPGIDAVLRLTARYWNKA
jgi:hypothetical protein